MYPQDRRDWDPDDRAQTKRYNESATYRHPAPASPHPTRPGVNIGMFAGGVVATAIVTGLAGWLTAWVIRTIFTRITESGKFGVWNPMAQDEYWFAVLGAMCALLAGALWLLLQFTTPSPEQFYTWIVGLLITAAIIVPVAASTDFAVGLATAIVHGFIGFPTLFLIRAVGAKCIQH